MELYFKLLRYKTVHRIFMYEKDEDNNGSWNIDMFT
jgi:hypothetical protein